MLCGCWAKFNDQLEPFGRLRQTFQHKLRGSFSVMLEDGVVDTNIRIASLHCTSHARYAYTSVDFSIDDRCMKGPADAYLYC